MYSVNNVNNASLKTTSKQTNHC